MAIPESEWRNLNDTRSSILLALLAKHHDDPKTTDTELTNEYCKLDDSIVAQHRDAIQKDLAMAAITNSKLIELLRSDITAAHPRHAPHDLLLIVDETLNLIESLKQSKKLPQSHKFISFIEVYACLCGILARIDAEDFSAEINKILKKMFYSPEQLKEDRKIDVLTDCIPLFASSCILHICLRYTFSIHKTLANPELLLNFTHNYLLDWLTCVENSRLLIDPVSRLDVYNDDANHENIIVTVIGKALRHLAREILTPNYAYGTQSVDYTNSLILYILKYLPEKFSTGTYDKFFIHLGVGHETEISGWLWTTIYLNSGKKTFFPPALDFFKELPLIAECFFKGRDVVLETLMPERGYGSDPQLTDHLEYTARSINLPMLQKIYDEHKNDLAFLARVPNCLETLARYQLEQQRILSSKISSLTRFFGAGSPSDLSAQITGSDPWLNNFYKRPVGLAKTITELAAVIKKAPPIYLKRFEILQKIVAAADWLEKNSHDNSAEVSAP